MISRQRPLFSAEIAVKALAVALPILVLVSSRIASAVQIEYTQNLQFDTTKKQSLFGPGDAGPPTIDEYRLTLKWAPDPVNSNNINIQVGDPLAGNNGLLIRGQTSGEFGLNNVFKFDPGGINVALNYDLTMKVPDYVSFKSGDFEVNTLAPKLNKGSFNTTSPRPEFYSEFILQGSAAITTGRARFNSPWSDEPYASTFDNTVLVNNFQLLGTDNKTVKVITFNAPDPANGDRPDGTLKILPVLKVLKKARATAKLLNEVDQVEGVDQKAATVGEALKFSLGTNTDPMLSLSFKVPYIALDQPNFQSGARFTGHDEFAALRVNLVKLSTTIANAVGVPIPPLQAKVGLDFVAGSLSASAAVVESNFTPRLELTQKTGIDASAILEKFDFGRDVNVGIKGGAAPTLRRTIDIQAGQTLVFKENEVAGFDPAVGPGDINLAPTFVAQPQLFNQFGIALGASIDASILKGSLKGDLLGLKLVDTKFAAIESGKIDLGLSAPIPITNFGGTSFTLLGFQDITSSPLTLTVSPLEWQNNVSGDWFDNTMWTPAGFPDGRGVTVSSNSGIVVDVKEPGAKKLRRAENLTVRGSAQVRVFADVAAPTPEHDKEFKIGGDIQLAVNSGAFESRRAALLIEDNATVWLTKTVDDVPDWTWNLSGPGVVRLNGNGAVLKVRASDTIADGSLNILGGGIDGFGTVNVEKTLSLNESVIAGGIIGDPNNATKTLNVNAEKVEVVGSQYASVLAAAAKAKLKLTTKVGEGITRDGGTDQNRLALLALPQGELHLEVSKIDSARFITRNDPITANSDGKIFLDRDMTLSNFVNDGMVETSKNIELLSSTLENNGTFQESGAMTTSGAATLSGTGRLNLKLSSLKLNNGATLVNGPSHTIAAIFPSISTLESLAADGSFTNQGRLLADSATMQLIAGSFKNDGLFEASGFFGGKFEMTGTAKLTNLTKSGAGDPTLAGGTYRLSDAAASMLLRTDPASTNFVNQANIQLFGARADESSGFTINGTDLRDMTSFLNDEFEFDPDTGLITADPGQITLGNGRHFLTNKLINKGQITLQGTDGGTTEIGNVANEGLVQAIIAKPQSVAKANTKAVVQLAIDDNDQAINKGTIRAIKDRNVRGSVELTVTSGGDGGEDFQNEGVVEVRNASLKFEGLNVDHGTGNKFVGGKWVIEGMPGEDVEGEIPNETTLKLDLATTGLPTVLAADVQFIGQNSHLQLNNTEFEQTINQIDGPGVLSLFGRSMTFSKDLTNDGTLVLGQMAQVVETDEKYPANDPANAQPVYAKVITNDAQIILKAPVNNSVGLTNNSTIMGAGIILATPGGKVVNSGMIVASDGELRFDLATIENSGQIIALGPNKDTQDDSLDLFAGAIGLKNSKIDGGTVDVHDGGALVGHGELLDTVTLTNNGLVVTRPDRADLSIPLIIGIQAGNKNVVNRGQMVATNGGTLVLKSPDAGGTLDNLNGWLVILPNADDSGPPGNYINGKIQLLNTTVDDGVVSARGAIDTNRPMYVEGLGFDMNGKAGGLDPTRSDNFARITGRGAKLNEVVIDIDSTAVVADTADTPLKDNSFQIAPLAGSAAKILNSTIVAVDGGKLTLVGTGGEFQLFGSDIISGPSQGVMSTIEFKGATVRGGLLKTDGGGEMHIVETSRFINVASQGELTVDANQVLQLAGVFHNEGGSLAEMALGNGTKSAEVNGFLTRGTLIVKGTVLLDGTTAIDGDFHIASGSDLLTGTLDVWANGFVDVNKTARILGTRILNAGTIRLDTDDDLTINESFDAIAPSASFTNGGKVRISDSSHMRVRNAKMTNKADVQIDGSGELIVATYEQTMGTTMVIGSGKIVGNMDLIDGTLGGTGKVTGNLNQTGGIVSPGLSPGTLFVGGNYDESAAGKYFVEIAALADFDSLMITGSALLSGKLEWVLRNGYMPGPGNFFKILTADAGVSGRFTLPALADQPALLPGLSWNVFYGTNDVILQVIPEPASIILCLWMTALGAQFVARRHRRRNGRV